MTETPPSSLDMMLTSRLQGGGRPVAFILAAAGIFLALNQTFNIRPFGLIPPANGYYYLIIGCFLAIAFLAFPARAADRRRIAWFDWLLAAAALAINIYFCAHATEMITKGWDLRAPDLPTYLAGAMCALALEAVRRTGGTALFVVCIIFGAYPLFADSMPGFLWGSEFTVQETVRGHIFGAESMIGIPLRTVADLLIGYLLFGVALVVTGGGDFFNDFANALLGRSRGGPAKVAVISSGLQGMISGSVVSNVITSGVMTIPTMQRCGYAPHYAAAVEACSSTGGAIMPPVMGAAAFIMASFLNVPYSEVVIAASLPAILYYLALYLQSDLYAARTRLKGLPESDIPKLWPVVKDGWPFLFSLAALMYLLLVVEIETYAAFAATAALLVVSVFRRRHRLTLRRFVDFIVESGSTVGQLVGILAGVGFIVGALSATGVGTSFSRELIQYAGGSLPLLLLLGAITSFVLGMGMTASSCYIFLAIVLAPALTQSGVPPMAAHMFILYCGTLSFITPPVALASISAAGINGSNPMKVGYTSMRLGMALFVVPFLFVADPTLILVGTWWDILQRTVSACLGVYAVSAAFEYYAYGVGRLGWVGVAVLLLAGTLLFWPGWMSSLAGLVLLVGAHALPRLVRPAGAATL